MIPSWVKNNAKWWSKGEIGDSDFVQGIQYMIQQGIMKIPKTNPQSGVSHQIPSWVKNDAGWWASGVISDNEFVAGIQFLINANIIQIGAGQEMQILSDDFKNNGTIPSQYTCDGDNISPPLEITGVPQNAKSLALIVYDPDAPKGNFTHWLVWNISPQKSKFVKGESLDFPQGQNDFDTNEYKGPCPPSGTHRYFFDLFALDLMLDIDQSSKKQDLEAAMSGHIIEQAILVGNYTRL